MSPVHTVKRDTKMVFTIILTEEFKHYIELRKWKSFKN